MNPILRLSLLILFSVSLLTVADAQKATDQKPAANPSKKAGKKKGTQKESKAKEQKPQPDQVVPYKTVDEITLNLHVFQPVSHKAGSKRPAIVFFFGGGWVGGSPSQFYSQARHLADLGMVAMCAEYRIHSKHKTSPKACVQDGKSAIRFVRSQAEKLGVDPERIAAAGGSAGGHVASATATLTAFDEPGEDTSISCRPQALALFNPVYDNGPDGWGHAKVKDYWQKISPMHNIKKPMPPSIVFLGTKDRLIPVETAKQFQQKMRETGAESQLELYEGAAHGFFNRGEPYQDTLQKTVTFFTKLGWI